MSEKIYCAELNKPSLSDDTLTHFGIKGMKWGKRKIRNSVKSLKGRRKRKKNNWGLVPEGTGRGTGSWESQDRRSRGFTGTIYKFREVSPMQVFESAMYNDPRYKSTKNAINTSTDKRFTRQGSGIDYNRDKRFTRNYNGINVYADPRFHGKYKRFK